MPELNSSMSRDKIRRTSAPMLFWMYFVSGLSCSQCTVKNPVTKCPKTGITITCTANHTQRKAQLHKGNFKRKYLCNLKTQYVTETATAPNKYHFHFNWTYFENCHRHTRVPSWLQMTYRICQWSTSTDKTKPAACPPQAQRSIMHTTMQIFITSMG